MRKGISDFVRFERIKQKLTQVNLVEKSGVSLRKVQSLEASRVIPDKDIELIFKALGYNLELSFKVIPISPESTDSSKN